MNVGVYFMSEKYIYEYYTNFFVNSQKKIQKNILTN